MQVIRINLPTTTGFKGTNSTTSQASCAAHGFPYHCQFDVPAGTHSLDSVASNITIGGVEWVLDAPPLNVTYQETNAVHQTYAINSLTGDSVTPRYAFDQMSLNETWIEQHNSCLSLNRYEWGFSSLLLFLFCITSLLFTATLAYLQHEIHALSRIDRVEDVSDRYTDTIDLYAELQLLTSKDIKTLPTSELVQSVRDDQDGVRSNVTSLPFSRREEKRRGSRVVEP